MKTKLFHIILLSIIVTSASGQGAFDALNYSQTYNGGTARFVSMGGAFGALGGDFSSLSYNPAGLGVYRSSEFTITPSFKSRKIASDYNGSSGDDTRNRMYFDNLGFVLSFKPYKDNESGLVGFNLGFGYNRTNDYYSNSYAVGENPETSIMDYFAAQANGYNSDDMSYPLDPNDTYDPYYALGSGAWEAIMAWNTYLINPDVDPNTYVAALNAGDGVLQRKWVSTTGSTGEYAFSAGLNFSNKLFLGATFGISSLNYSTSSKYWEDAFNTNDSLNNGYRFYYSDYRQTVETKGAGYNLKIGAIYKPIEGLRLGLALHTPTFYNLEDTYSYSLYANFDQHQQEYGLTENTPNARFDYSLETPFKVIGSVAYVFKDFGLLTLDIEHVNYSTMKLRDGSDGYDFPTENADIKDAFKDVYNIRLGGEARIDKVFLRAGYAYYPSPYNSEYLNKGANRTIISGGIGYRSGNFFVDAAYQHSMQKDKYVFYDAGGYTTNPISTKTTEGKVLVTVGFKF